MFSILHLDHVVLRVRDVQAMLRFYVDVLGCTIEREREELGLYQVRAGTCLIDFVTVDGKLGRAGGAPPGAQGRHLDHFGLRIEPFEGETLRAWLTSRGAQPGEIAQRYGADGEGPSLYLRDPEGNVVELKGPPSAPPV